MPKQLVIASAVFFFTWFNANAQVSITPFTDPLCTNNGYTFLSDIIITETAPADFNVDVTPGTIILTPVSGSFFPGSGSVTFDSPEVTASIAVTDTEITITLVETDDTNASVLNTLTISGIQFISTVVGLTDIQYTGGTIPGVNGLAVNDVVASVDVKDNPNPIITGQFDVCKGSTHSYSTEAGHSNYTWILGGGSIIAGGTSTDNTVDVQWSSGTEGNIRVSYINANGCPSAETFEFVNLAGYPNGISSNLVICSNVGLKLTLQTNITNGVTSSFEWSAVDRPNITGETTIPMFTGSINDVLVNTSAVTDSVKYTVIPTSAVGGCVGTSFVVTLKVRPVPNVTITNSQPVIPNGGTTAISFTSNLAGSNFTYSVAFPPEILGATDGNGNSIIQTLTNAGGVAQVVTYTVFPDNAGCSGPSVATKVTVNGVPSVITADSLALVSFYNSTNGSSWLSSANWLTGAVNTWEGVIVTVDRVTEIVLKNNNLTGPISPDIGNLSSLTNLTLDGNVITSPIPASLGNLTDLNILKLGFNSFSETLPISVLNLINLTELQLQGSNFTGPLSPAIGNLTALNLLDLSQNQFTGTIPVEVGNLTGIQHVDLSGNQLTGPIPAAMGSLTGLQILKLHDNQLSGSIPLNFAGLLNLLEFYLNDNLLTGDVPNFSSVSGPLLLHLENNNFTGLPDLSAGNYSAIAVENNSFTFEDLEPNIAIPAFTYVPQNSIPTAGLQNLKAGQTFTATITVGGSANQYQWKKNTVDIPGETSNTFSKTNISLSDIGAYELTTTNTLVPGLILLSEPIALIVTIPTNPTDSLAAVALYNSTGGSGWTNKTNWLSGKIDTWYGITMVAGRIKKIELSGNNLVGSLPVQIGSLIAMDTLTLSNNQLSGSIPTSIGNLLSMHYLDLSSNLLNATLPTEIGNLPALENLFLQKNNFSGVVPASINTLSVLHKCDLSENKFTAIPNLSGLSLNYLNVAKNKLSFGSLEANISISSFIYSPQDSVGIKKDTLIQTATPFEFTSSVSGTANHYKWKKDTTTIAAAIGATYNIPSPVFADEGSYTVEVTNTIVTGLKLIGRPTNIKVSSLKRDSLALVQLYNATSGTAWTNKTGWLSGKLNTWLGVTISSNRVTNINLSNNNLSGSIPGQINEMLSLKTMDVSSNKISAIPQMIPLTQLTVLNVSGNKLDFSSLELNVAILPLMNYLNQADIGIIKNDSIAAGSPYTLTASIGGGNNLYQWKKNNVAVSGATSGTYNITAIGRSNMGKYTCEITNSVVSGLMIKSKLQTVLAVADLSGKLLAATDVPATKGTVSLFRITSSNGYDTLASKKITSNGSYTFNKVVLDNYQLMGFADTITHKGALPTFYKKTILWEEADTLFVNGSLVNLNIISVFKPLPPSGKGEISGIVEQDDAGGRVKKTKRVENAGASVRRVENTGRGKDEVLTLVAYVFTNANGEFKITNLPTGNYRLNIQYPGYPMDVTSFINIPIGTGLQSQVQVEASVAKGKITVRQLIVTGISFNEAYSAEVYPNPTKEFIKISFASTSASRKVNVMDETGREIIRTPAHSHEVTLDVRSFKNGSYLLSVEDTGKIVKTFHIVIE